MKLITRFELSKMNEGELKGLLGKIFNELAQSEPHSAKRRNALASIENIERELYVPKSHSSSRLLTIRMANRHHHID